MDENLDVKTYHQDLGISDKRWKEVFKLGEAISVKIATMTMSESDIVRDVYALKDLNRKEALALLAKLTGFLWMCIGPAGVEKAISKFDTTENNGK